MRCVAKALSWAALAAVTLAPVLFLTQSITQSQMKVIALAATVVWFIAAPLWIRSVESSSIK